MSDWLEHKSKERSIRGLFRETAGPDGPRGELIDIINTLVLF